MRVLPLILLFLATPALAGPDCQKAATEEKRAQCAARDAKTAHDKLHETYVHLVEMLDETDRLDPFRASQAAWREYQISTCTVEAMLKEAEAERPYVIHTCLERTTFQRIRELKLMVAQD